MQGRDSYQVPGQHNLQKIYPIDLKDASLARVPWFLPFEPPLPIAAAATGQVDQTIGWQDFVCIQVGFTSEEVGFPALPGTWKIQIQDIQASKNFQPEGFDITALLGGNFGMADSPPVDLPVPWVFMEKSTIRVFFENTANLGGIPHLLLIGYLTNWEREATAAAAHEELILKIMRRQAGEPGDDRWGQ